MRFTPVIFASVAAASVYYGEAPSSSAPASSSSPAWPEVTSSSPAGYWPKPSSTSSSSSSTTPKAWKTTTLYETECWTVTSSSSTKVWTSVKAIPTVCEEEEEWPVSSMTASSTPATWAAPVKPTTPAAPVYSSVGGSWPAGAAKPSGTGSWTSPYAAQFTGAASAQKAGALLAGAGAVAAMLL
ncbi:hypothetical protein, variant [Verruconis gallopava]|uniref:Uncharacterized protein n=1 Tax=Verruconis gallopava TaxID=253628 RepID=A0A0D2APM5_9PEZI|nr:hypothetical protein, variant [Verruconis gallopava]KIW01119.1 hypothetical protein, variant [Verruconis gallopava]